MYICRHLSKEKTSTEIPIFQWEVLINILNYKNKRWYQLEKIKPENKNIEDDHNQKILNCINEFNGKNEEKIKQKKLERKASYILNDRIVIVYIYIIILNSIHTLNCLLNTYVYLLL